MNQDTIESHNRECEAGKKTVRRRLAGPWDNEPNRKNWQHAGLDCMIVRVPSMLHLCGYVGVKPGHPLFGMGYDAASEKIDADVHGGLTFADSCSGNICHVSDDPEDKTWWFGFDCTHYGDVSPMMSAYHTRGFADIGGPSGEYRTIEFVTQEAERLAEQISKAK